MLIVLDHAVGIEVAVGAGDAGILGTDVRVEVHPRGGLSHTNQGFLRVVRPA